MSWMSQFLAATALMHAIPFDGVLRVFVRDSLQLPAADQKTFLQSALLLNILAVLMAGIATFPYVEMAGGGILDKLELAGSFILLMVGFVTLFTSMAYWQAHLEVKKYALTNAASTVCGLVALTIGSYCRLPIQWLLMLWLGGQTLPLVFTWPLLGFQSLGLRVNASRYLPKIFHAAVAISLIIVIGRITEVVARAWVIEKIGVERTGLWQAIVRISDVYMVPLNAVLAMVFYPKAAALAHERPQLLRLLLRWLAVILGLALLGLLLLYALKDWVIQVFMSPDFAPASQWMDAYLWGDFFKIASYLLTAIAIINRQNKALIIGEFVSASIYLGSIHWGLDKDPAFLTNWHAYRYALYCGYWVVLLSFYFRPSTRAIR